MTKPINRPQTLPKARSPQGWKEYAPCKAASTPELFDIPRLNDWAAWNRAVWAATNYCAGCPFLFGACADDSDGFLGLWAGSVRRPRLYGGVEWWPLIDAAPAPTVELAFRRDVADRLSGRAA